MGTSSTDTSGKMKDQTLIYSIFAAIALGIFTNYAAGLPASNEEEVVEWNEALSAEIVPIIDSIIQKLSAIEHQDESPIVNFSSYTYWNPTKPDLLDLDTRKLRSQLRSSFFDAARSTVFVADGPMENGVSEMCTRLRDEYVKFNNTNVIVVDWAVGQTFPSEESAATEIHGAAKKIATLVAKLVIYSHLELDRTIFVGHSMGAHVMGAAGRILKGLIGAVVGLDPSNFASQTVEDRNKLGRSSAKYVQVVHTNAGNLGLNETIGSADFFANNGIHQPGCRGKNVCSHKRAWQYFAESINPVAEFYATKCSNEEYFGRIQHTENDVSPECTSGTLAHMGGQDLDLEAQGIFVFETLTQSPFALGAPLQHFHHIAP